MSLAAFAPPGLGEAGVETRRTIPFDQSFTFKLAGEPNKVTNKTVTVSIEAAFTAVAIGYGVLPDVERTTFGPTEVGDIDLPEPTIILLALAAPAVVGTGDRTTLKGFPIPEEVIAELKAAGASIADLRNGLAETLSKIKTGGKTPLAAIPSEARSVLAGPPTRLSVGDLVKSLARTLGESDFGENIGPRTAAALATGIRLNPDVARFFLQSKRDVSLHPDQIARLFETVSAPPDRIQFLYALFDEGTGREFQSEPILNIAGLGIADGDRPFRYFAQPITFLPRTTVRLEITEKSAFKGELHVSLHGFKVLGGAGTPTSRVGRKVHRTR